MKKCITIVALLCMTCFFSSCKKDEAPETPANKLVNTKWTSSYGDDKMYVLDFTSNVNVTIYLAHSNGAIDGNATSGRYSVSGNNVTFTNVILKPSYYSSSKEVKTGTINGTILKTNGTETLSNGQVFSWNETWNKQ